MKLAILTIVLLTGKMALAEIDPFIFVSGKIGSSLNKNEVLVIDEFNQKYYLPKSNFPEHFNFKVGQPFEIEISKDQFDKVKVLK